MALGFFASLLAVERTGAWSFAASLWDHGDGSSFGGDALARLVLAAAQTVDDKALHALHASFLRPLPPAVPLAIRVEPLADGRRFARRRAALAHADRALCEVVASFAAPFADGAAWQDAPMPDAPAPETLPKDLEVAARAGWTWDLEHEEFEWGFVDEAWHAGGVRAPSADSRFSLWLRPRAPLPDDARVHAAALVYASDVMSHWAAGGRLGRGFAPGAYVSLDHALRIHRAPRWDDWWLFHDFCDVARDGRVLVHRRIFARDGALLASISQEALIAEPA